MISPIMYILELQKVTPSSNLYVFSRELPWTCCWPSIILTRCSVRKRNESAVLIKVSAIAINALGNENARVVEIEKRRVFAPSSKER